MDFVIYRIINIIMFISMGRSFGMLFKDEFEFKFEFYIIL